MGAGGAGRVGSAGRPGRAARASGATVATLTASTTVAELLKNECGIGRPIEQCVLVAIPPEQPLRALVIQRLYSIRSERLLMEETNCIIAAASASTGPSRSPPRSTTSSGSARCSRPSDDRSRRSRRAGRTPTRHRNA